MKDSRIYLFSILVATILLVACSSESSKYQMLANSFNNNCPVMLMDGEVELTNIAYSDGLFHINITLHDDAPISVRGLQTLNDEYSREMKETDENNPYMSEKGGRMFLCGVISESPILSQIIDSIAIATSTVESTQGYVPLEINICDATDKISYEYNVEWEAIDKQRWLSAIMPVEIQRNFGYTNNGKMPKQNEKVQFNGITSISEDNYLTVHCSYDAMPHSTNSYKPMNLCDIKGTFFSVPILMNHLKQMKNAPDRRFLKACAKRGVGIRFLLKGDKDAIDPDMVSAEEFKKCESRGGNDTIVISAKQLLSLYNNN